jgi:response regulator RpfG family c-di-GMP phosphodiesterase
MSHTNFDLLIVDDDRGILELLTASLADQSLAFQTADSLSQARRVLDRSEFKIVLSDHNLPDGNGVDFLAEMRGWGVKSVPILMTGLMDLTVAIDAINRGKVFRFVTKPLDLAALDQAIAAALEHYDSQQRHDQLTREVIQYNESLHREAETKELTLRAAVEDVRAERQTVERQKAHIEELYAETQQAYLHTVTSLTAAIEAKDRYTRGHSERVFYYCIMVADVLGLPESSRQDLRFASLLHDLGKIGIPDAILLKPGRLTPEEQQVMYSHPLLTEDILRPLPFLGNVRRIIREHHERFDGKGYPEGLVGRQISLEGRILSISDSYDAMRSNRAYRQALSKDRALAEVKAGAGIQFCPLCAGALTYAVETRSEYQGPHSLEDVESRPEEELFAIRPASEKIHVNNVMN